MDFWTPEKVLRLIELYEQHRLLWDNQDTLFKNSKKREDAWNLIGIEMNESIVACKKKVHSLHGQYRREKLKEDTSKIENGMDSVYNSKWYPFKRLKFLEEKLKRKRPAERKLKSPDSEASLTTEILDIKEDMLDPLGEEEISDKCVKFSATIVSNDNDVKPIIQKQLHLSPEANNNYSTQSEASMSNDTNGVMNSVYSITQNSDEYNIYARTVADRLRKLKNPKSVCIVKHKIDNILFKAELKSYSRSPSSRISYSSLPSPPCT